MVLLLVQQQLLLFFVVLLVLLLCVSGVCAVELLTELLSTRHEKGQVLSLSVSLSRAPKQQEVHQQLQQTVSSICLSLSVPLPQDTNPQQLGEAMQAAAAAIASNVREQPSKRIPTGAPSRGPL